MKFLAGPGAWLRDTIEAPLFASVVALIALAAAVAALLVSITGDDPQAGFPALSNTEVSSAPSDPGRKTAREQDGRPTAEPERKATQPRRKSDEARKPTGESPLVPEPQNSSEPKPESPDRTSGGGTTGGRGQTAAQLAEASD